MKKISYALAFSLALASCASLQDPIHKNFDQEKSAFKFVAIPNAQNISSASGGYYSSGYTGFGGITSKEVDPSSIIEGIMLKKGYTSVPEKTENIIGQTLLVRYGQSGKRSVLLGYTLEVTIKIVAQRPMNLYFSVPRKELV